MVVGASGGSQYEYRVREASGGLLSGGARFAGGRVVFQAVLLALQEIVELLNQLQELVLVLFGGDLFAKSEHPVSFVRGQWDTLRPMGHQILEQL
jgi:hypothetical protein